MKRLKTGAKSKSANCMECLYNSAVVWIKRGGNEPKTRLLTKSCKHLIIQFTNGTLYTVDQE